MCNHMVNLAKLDDGLDESPKLGKNRGILKPSWAFVKTKILDMQHETLAESKWGPSYNIASVYLYCIWTYKILLLPRTQNLECSNVILQCNYNIL